MTPYERVYEAFLAKILEDEWENWEPADIEADLRQILEGAIPLFKFPRVSLERDEKGFKEDLSNTEIQILATYMKCEWLNRNILTWENVKPMYAERDFSPGNLLGKLIDALAAERLAASRLERNYYRSIDGRPFNYGRLAGGKDGQ